MKIGILGTRGIPNYYGGFEQFAEYLSVGLVKRGHDVSVYNGHTHPYQESIWNGVKIIHCNDPEEKLGTAGQFIYDLNCIRDCKKRNFDIILQLGYTSSSVWGKLLPRDKSIVTTNMDGLEWKRTKYSKPVRWFLRYAEKLGVQTSDYLIADSVGIQEYLKEKYQKDSIFIPYGANVFEQPNQDVLKEYGLEIHQYNMLIARLEPENSIEQILDGVMIVDNSTPFLVIGKYNTKYGAYLRNKYENHGNIRFLGGIYDINKLNNLRYFSNIYFHGHTVGGTNPSLLEAMSSKSLICAQSNVFNRSILAGDAFYFENSNDVAWILINENKQKNYDMTERNIKKIETTYSWDNIVDQYLDHFVEISLSGHSIVSATAGN